MNRKRIITSLLDSFIETKKSSFLHIDSIYSKRYLESNEELFMHGIVLFNEIVAECIGRKIFGINIDLLIELESTSPEIIGAPDSLKSLLNIVDIYSMPEISISACDTIAWPPKIELYATPLPFTINQVPNDCISWYEEYRTIQEMIRNDIYTRWLTIRYVNNY